MSKYKQSFGTYLALIWIFHGRKVNKSFIRKIFKIIYGDFSSSFEDLLRKHGILTPRKMWGSQQGASPYGGITEKQLSGGNSITFFEETGNYVEKINE